MINVWMPVFNEETHLLSAINSVLNQSYEDFNLLISNNHSTDSSLSIVNESAKHDSRIRVFEPPKHLSSLEHIKFMSNDILSIQSSRRYSIFIGGHDIWDKDLLKVLISRSEKEPNSAIVYTDSWRIGHSGELISRYEGIFQTQEVSRPFIPLQVLTSLTFNLVWGGLWRESARKLVQLRHNCSSADHLMLAEIALHGSILYQTGSAVYLRDATNAGEWATYVTKHIPENIRQHPILDFINQLEWCDYLIEKAVAGSEFSSDPLKSSLKNSLFSAYIFRYYHSLKGHAGGLEAFFGNPRVQDYLSSENLSNAFIIELINSRQKNFPTLEV